MNLILRTNDAAMRTAFFRLAPRWRMTDPELSVGESHVLVVDLRTPVQDKWLNPGRGWIALGETSRHFHWAAEHGATLFLMWPCSPEQLDHALQATEQASPVNAVVAWPNNIEWDREGATIKKGQVLINLTPLESDIMALLWGRRMVYTSPAQILHHVWRGSIATEQNVYVYIRSLRRKLERMPDHPCILINRYGMGYRLAPVCQITEREELADAR